MAFVSGAVGCRGARAVVPAASLRRAALEVRARRAQRALGVVMCVEQEEADAPAQDERIPRKMKTTIALEDLRPDMELEGLVRTVTNYGAFVDVGTSTDGLLHVSQMSSSFVQNVGDIVKVGDKLPVRIRSVDLEKGNFALTLLTKEQENAQGGQAAGAQSNRVSWNEYEIPNEKEFVDGKVVSITQFGAFVDVNAPTDGMVHISAMRESRVESVESVLNVGDAVKVRVTNVDRQRNRIALSMLEYKEKPESSGASRDYTPRRRQEEDVDVEGKASKEELATFLDGQPELKSSFQIAWERAQAKAST